MRLLLVLAVSDALAACAAPMTIMVHPQTGQTATCQASGRGLIPAIRAGMSVSNCEEAYRGLGFKKSTDLTIAERQAIEGLAKPSPGRSEDAFGVEIR